MKNIKTKIEELNKTVEKIENAETKIVISQISDILKDLTNKVDEILVNEAVLAENFKYMDEDISGIQEELFEEVSLEYLDEQDEYKEIKCKNCGKEIFTEESALENNDLKCPYCGEKIN